MSRMKVQSSTVEEKFMFGSPPLLNGFTYTSCRSQEASYNSAHEVSTLQSDNPHIHTDVEENTDMIKSSPARRLNGYSDMLSNAGYSRSYTPQQSGKNGYRNVSNSLVDNLHQLSINTSRTSHVDNGIKILEQAGLKIQNNNELVFKKRKDLRVLKSVLSSERFREVVMKFGDGDEGGREIVESVHKTMRSSCLSCVTCIFCSSESQVYENFPVVDGTLFLTPVQLTKHCVKFSSADDLQRYMGYICVKCMEGKSKTLGCTSCHSPWNGSFFQIGTLYSYNILFATPCCQDRVSCNKCHKSILDLANGDASNLFFSHFSKNTTCPHCNVEDFHFVKSLSCITAM